MENKKQTVIEALYIYIYRERERERERDVVADIKKEETRIDWTYSMNGLGKES